MTVCVTAFELLVTKLQDYLAYVAHPNSVKHIVCRNV